MTTEGNFVQPAIPRFDGHYDHWSMLMENFLRSKEYWDLVETGYDVPEEGVTLTTQQQQKLDEQKLKDMKVKNYLFQAIDRTILETILQKDTSKNIWDSLKKKYQGSARVKRAQLQALRKSYENLEMKNGESVHEYFARTMTIANNMRIHGDKLGDGAIVEKILRSLAPKFNYIVCSIEESKNTEDMSIDELESSLVVHEQQLNRGNTERGNTEEHALSLVESSRSRGRGRGRSQWRGRGGRGTRDGGRQHHNFKRDDVYSHNRGRGTGDKSNTECYRCGKYGHYRNECYSKMPYNKEKEEKSNFAESKEESTEEETLLMAFHAAEETDSEVWYVDTGASNHMSGSKSSFSFLNENFHTTVSFGDHSKVDVMGKGNIQFKTKNDFVETISNVFYVPSLKTN